MDWASPRNTQVRSGALDYSHSLWRVVLPFLCTLDCVSICSDGGTWIGSHQEAQ
jgi:hypothetical protein